MANAVNNNRLLGWIDISLKIIMPILLIAMPPVAGYVWGSLNDHERRLIVIENTTNKATLERLDSMKEEIRGLRNDIKELSREVRNDSRPN